MAVAITHSGKIGPNSIIQTIAALREAYGPVESSAILVRGGSADLLDRMPTAMVDEREFHSLARLLVDQIGDEHAGHILKRAGQLTAEYLLQNRIPRPIQLLLRALPPWLGLRLLLPAINKNAWTFAGSGAFEYTSSGKPYVSIANRRLSDAPELAAAVCSYYKGTFEHLLRTLVDRRVALWENSCQAQGGHACVYQIV